MDKTLLSIIWIVCTAIYLADSDSSLWKWQYDTVACYNDNDNATLKWRVTLNSNDAGVANVVIKEVLVDGGGTVNIIGKTTGPYSAYKDRAMSLTVDSVSSGPPPVFDVTFTMVVNNTIDGFAIKKLRCTVASKPNTEIGEKDSLLKVQVPIHNFVVPSVVTVNEFHPITLSCSADGTPAPTIRWTDPQGQTLAHDGVYNITRTTRNMTGEYTCIVTDRCGRNHTKSSYVLVQYKPENTHLTKVTPLGNIVCQHDRITITCNASARPQVSGYTFYNNGVKLVTQGSATFTTGAIYGGANILTCETTNAAGRGKNNASITVFANVPTTRVLVPSSVTVTEYDSIILNCTADGNPPPHIRWVNQQEQVLRNGSLYSIANVTREMNGLNYACHVTDGCGRPLSRSTLLIVQLQFVSFIKQDKCIAESANFTDITVRSNPTATVSCKAGNETLRLEVKRLEVKTTVYRVTWQQANEVSQITCHASNFAAQSSYTFAIYKTGFHVTKYGSFRISNVTCPPSQDVKDRVKALVDESVDKACVDEITLSYRCGSLIVDVAMTITANIPDPFIALNNSLVENGPRYNLTIYNVKMNQVSPLPPSSGLSDTEIIIISAGCAAFLLVLLILICWICCVKRRKKKTTTTTTNNDLRTLTFSEDDILEMNIPPVGRDNLAVSAEEASPVSYADHGPTANRRRKEKASNNKYTRDVPDGGHETRASNGHLHVDIRQPTAQRSVLPPRPPILEIRDITDKIMRLRWTAPPNDGHRPVIDYKVEVGSSYRLEKIVSNSIVIPDLTPYTKYLVKVSARNKAGYGSPGSKTVITKKAEEVETII